MKRSAHNFSEAETVNLTMLIATINAWNRIAISFRAVPQMKAKRQRGVMARDFLSCPGLTRASI